MPTPEQLSSTLDILGNRKREYQGIPQGVLEDLARFCRADESCWDPDARIHAALEGRREVYLRIMHHLNLTPEELLVYYSKGELSADMLKGTEFQRG